MGYKINLQNSSAFLYNNNKFSEKEVIDTIPFTIASMKIKYLGIHLPKEMKCVYDENFKSLKKRIEEDKK